MSIVAIQTLAGNALTGDSQHRTSGTRSQSMPGEDHPENELHWKSRNQ